MRFSVFFYLVINSLLTCVYSAEWEGVKSNWKGFDRFDFTFKNKKCFVVIPKVKREKNPWVWRSRWPSYHTEPDLLLLEKGFHILHINTGGMFGSDKSLKYWDEFYDLITKKYNLSQKVSLVACSRGGLFVYRWASLNPRKVACIFGDVPVCDFKSWPLGQGKGVGDKKSWDKLLIEYKLTHDEALEYNKNPIDCLDPIAKENIPIFHLISTTDKVVPPEENTNILETRYKALGGDIKVLEVHGSQKAQGHHFTHPNPELVRDFIVENN